MRRMITIAALALALPFAVACSDDGPLAPAGDLGIEGIGEGEVVAVADATDLSDADRERIREILRSGRESILRLREAVRGGDLTVEEARARARRVHDDTIAALSEILTDDQIARLRARLRHGPRDDRPNDPPGERPDLELTEEQRAAIGALHEEMRAFLAEVRAAVRSGEITAREGRAMVRERAAELRAEVCGILTEDQRTDVPFCAG